MRAILGTQLLGMHLSDSLAMGDFDESSDIDTLIVTTDALPEEMVCALAQMHERLSAAYPRWRVELEASYIPYYAIHSYDPAEDWHPHIVRHESLRLEEYERESNVQRHIIRERGIVLAGPAPQTLIDPVHPNDLRWAVLVTLREVWP